MHALVSEALAMGFEKQHAAAAIAPFAKEVASGSTRALSVALHGDAFVEFLFNHPAEEFAAAATPPLEQAANLQQQRRSSTKRAAAPACFDQQHFADHADSDCDDKENDEDFMADEGVTQVQQHPKQPQQRKRLRRSSESTPVKPAAAAADAGRQQQPNLAAQVAQHRNRTLHGSVRQASDEDLMPAAGAAAGSRLTASRNRSSQRPDFDCYISDTPSSRLPCAAAAEAAGHGVQQPQCSRPTAARPSLHSSSKLNPGQARLDRFFAASQHEEGEGKLSTPAATAGRGRSSNAGLTQTLLSPLDLIKVHSSSGSRAAATRTPAAAAEGVRSFITPGIAAGAATAGFRRSMGSVLQQGTPASAVSARTAVPPSKCISRFQQQQQQQQQQQHMGSIPSPAVAAVAPWYAPLAISDKTLDAFDLVNLKVFGHKGFRPQQKEIVQQAVAGRDLFVLMPTGGGKSLCYQLPAVICKGVTVVVCPLLSLMQDQVKALCCNPLGGVPTSYLSSQQTAAEATAVKNELKKGIPSLKLLYVTPEQLVKSESLRKILQGLAQRGRLARFVIDEAHCVSTWGHDFRPDYKGLAVLRKSFPQTPITAVTATATGRVQSDILSILGITRSVTVHQTSFLRPNLVFKVVPKVRERDEDSDQPLFITKLIQYIKHQMATAPAAAAAAAAAAGGVKVEPGSATANGVCSGIVYCLSRKEAEGLAVVLKEVGGLKAGHYHAGMTPKQRMEVQNAFFSGQLSVIVATIAFGMGIDKPDVRFVVHFCISKSLEGYYQEAGRAGRDGLPAECVLMYSPADRGRIEYMTRMSLRGSKASKKLESAMAALDVMKDYAINPNRQCRHAIMLNYFGVQAKDLPQGKCNTSCDVCRGEVVPLNPEEWAEHVEHDQLTIEDSIDLLDSDDEGNPEHSGEQIVLSGSSSSDQEGGEADGSSSSGSGGSSSGGEDAGGAGSGDIDDKECSSPGSGSPQQQQHRHQQQAPREQQQQQHVHCGGFQSARVMQQQQQDAKPQLSRTRQQQQQREQQQHLTEEPDFSGLNQTAAAATGRAAASVGMDSSKAPGNAFVRSRVPAKAAVQPQHQQFSGFVSAADLSDSKLATEAAGAATADASTGGATGSGIWRQKRSGPGAASSTGMSGDRTAAAAGLSTGRGGSKLRQAAEKAGTVGKDPMAALAQELRAVDSEDDFM